MPYKPYFDRFDAELLKLSPRGDIMLLRVIAAVIPVTLFGLDALYGLPALYWLGLPFYLFCLAIYLEALLKTLLFMRKVSAELLIVLVMSVTLIDGAPLSGAMVAWFIGLGLYISFTIIRKNREKIQSLIQEGKKTAQVLRGGAIVELPINQISKDAVVLIAKGAMVPVDGVILEGNSSIDESSITGEPFPVYKDTGSNVTSGTLNLTGPLQVKADKNGDDSFLSVITQQIEASLENKSELQQRADITVQILLLSVTAYAFLLWFMTGSLHVMATALAVVCPCAWALATPTAFAANIGRLTRSNILARGGEPLENLQDIKTLILDKTGTVTLAEPEVKQVIELGLPQSELLALAASIESRFDHPIARAIIHFAKQQGLDTLLPVAQAEDLPGRGIKAKIKGQNGIYSPLSKFNGRRWLIEKASATGML